MLTVCVAMTITGLIGQCSSVDADWPRNIKPVGCTVDTVSPEADESAAGCEPVSAPLAEYQPPPTSVYEGLPFTPNSIVP